MEDVVRNGGCACGAVRWQARGEPRRVGLCHCMDCRKAHGATFNPFVVYAREQVTIEGTPTPWRSSAEYVRWFCGTCGSRVFGEQPGEYELSLGGFDEVGVLAPQYENWCLRREPWLPDLGIPQHDRDRPR